MQEEQEKWKEYLKRQAELQRQMIEDQAKQRLILLEAEQRKKR